jgi:hypothetical protein
MGCCSITAVKLIEDLPEPAMDKVTIKIPSVLVLASY